MGSGSWQHIQFDGGCLQQEMELNGCSSPQMLQHYAISAWRPGHAVTTA
jgi:hypothetical protein